MSISYEVDDKTLNQNFKKWAKKFGDSNKQAVARLAVSVARETAILVEPRGKSKKPIVGAIMKDARKNIVGIPAKGFTKLTQKRSPGFKFDHQWVTLRSHQLLRDKGEINAFIERTRDGKGRVRKLPANHRGVCRKKDFNAALVERKKWAGEAKGSFIGAGLKAARFQRGGSRLTIGKNFMAFAQKHADEGTAKRKLTLRGPSINLRSFAEHTKSKRILPFSAPREAARRAWKNTAGWYRRAIKELEK